METRTQTPRLDSAKTEEIEVLRRAAHQRVEDTSLRGTGREIGLSPTGLKKFLLGTAPYSPTLRRLRTWYVRHAAELGDRSASLTQEDAVAALKVLTNGFDAATGRVLAVQVTEALRSAYRETGRTPPVWVEDLYAACAA